MQFVTPAVGDVVGGRYRIVRALGSGGMSTVFEAENTFTNKRVALKWLLPAVGSRPEARERLLREARAGSRIKHRHVVDIYDVAVEGESMFLVMALLQGETLGRLLETRTTSVQALLQLLLPVMRGVAEAHRQGVIHRDIKPDNIFLAHEVDHATPVPVVLDFGIAKIEGDALRTISGSAIGTPVFMSFEQIRGLRDLDARVDVYGFGVILYMALTGRLPHSADTWPELVYKLSTADVASVAMLRPGFSPALSAVVERALERDRDTRTASLESLIAQLVPFAETHDDLGQTLLVTYERELLLPPVLGETQPSTSLLPTDRRIPTEPLPGSGSHVTQAGSHAATTDEKPALALSSQRETQTGNVTTTWLTSGSRARYAVPMVVLALGALALVVGSGVLRGPLPSQVGVSVPGTVVTRPGAVSTLVQRGSKGEAQPAPGERAEAASMVRASARASAQDDLPDAALRAAALPPPGAAVSNVVTRVGSTMRVRRTAPVDSADDRAKPAAPAPSTDARSEKPPRHRLANEDFFGAAP